MCRRFTTPILPNAANPALIAITDPNTLLGKTVTDTIAIGNILCQESRYCRYPA